jgi:6,7-dimethyl-8-ribityllumazine synthase
VSALRGQPRGDGRRVAIVASRFNQTITDRLVAGAKACLAAHGVAEENILCVSVPGAWELPWSARRIADTRRFDAIVAIGCVIRGETAHFDYVAGPASDGLARVALDTGVPVAFAVLTTETPEQAYARAGGALGNKGWEAAEVALELIDLASRLREMHEDT